MEISSFFIDNVAVDRLLNPIKETRVRALLELSSILSNNLIFEANKRSHRAARADLRVVNLEHLVRNLIRWFQFEPISHASDVLDLLALIFSRKDFLKYISSFISITRLRKEMSKIEKLITEKSNEQQKLHSINQFLNNYESGSEDSAVDDSFPMVGQQSLSTQSSSTESSLVERVKGLLINSPCPSSISKCDKEEEHLTENRGWEKLKDRDLEYFKYMYSEITQHSDYYRFNETLKCFRATISDYPPEFFLQNPNIFELLVDVWDMEKLGSRHAIEILRQLRFIINRLKDRWLELKENIKKDNGIVSIKKNVNHLLQMFTNYFEKFVDSFDGPFFNEQLDVLGEVYRTLFDISIFISHTKCACELYLNELLNMMAKVVKYLRILYNSGKWKDPYNSQALRLHYIANIYIISSLVSSINTANITAFCENNIWEYECDIALLDLPLRLGFPKIYKLIKRSRKDIIKDDTDLMLLLNAYNFWMPVVEIFQKWDTMSDEDIIFKGLESVDTIRIHKSAQLVELLFQKIIKCSEKFDSNEKLKQVTEELYLRLISNEMPEIRQQIYLLSKNNVQKLLTETNDEESTAGRSLCSIIGIPITTEIITEMLCFGYNDSNQLLQANVKMILFALLRAKIVYRNNWRSILEVIKPILPLFPCLFTTDQQLGMFAFDIYHQHSGFDDTELSQAYARFMFSDSQKARQMAKFKLLESLKQPDITQELLEIIPDDFCIIPKSQVSDIMMPSFSIGYDEEAYENTCQLLRIIDRSDDDLVKSTFLQLSVIMNSANACKRAHDDNIWVFFMASLEIDFPYHSDIRKLTVNILYKWAVTVPNFRIYMSNEIIVLKFLVKTLIYYQEDINIKKQTSGLLFMLLFSDFIVATEKSISMPRFLSALRCPFKFNEHWIESPFNKVMPFEQLYDAMKGEQGQLDIMQVSRNYVKYTFAALWFESAENLMDLENFSNQMYQQSAKVMRVPENLKLTESDVKCITEAVPTKMFKKFIYQMDNASEPVNCAMSNIETILLLPIQNLNLEVMEKRLNRYILRNSDVDNRDEIFLFEKVIHLFMDLIPLVTDENAAKLITSMTNNNHIFQSIIQSNDRERYEIILDVFNAAIVQCSHRPQLKMLVIKYGEQQNKFHLPNRIMELTLNNIFNKIMHEKKWRRVSRDRFLRINLILLRNILNVMPINSDDKYLNMALDNLLKLSIAIISDGKNSYAGASAAKDVMSVILKIVSSINNIEMKENRFKVYSHWCSSNSRDHVLSWIVLAELTRKKSDFIEFCREFRQAAVADFSSCVVNAIMDPKASPTVKKAVTAVIGNFLDHEQNSSDKENQTNMRSSHNGYGWDITHYENFIYAVSDSENSESLCYMIRKMIQNEMPEICQILIKRPVLQKLIAFQNEQNDDLKAIKNIRDILETICVCYKFEPLKELTIEIINFISGARLSVILRLLMDSKKCPLNMAVAVKQYNHNAFNLLAILSQSEIGLEKLHRSLKESQNLDGFIIGLHEGLRILNHHNELMFQLGFLNTLLDGCIKFESQAIQIFGNNYFATISDERIQVLTKEIKESSNSKNKTGDILEEQFERVHFAGDLVFLQVVSIFNYVDSSRFSAEYKYDLKMLAFLVLKKMIDGSERMKTLVEEIKLHQLIIDKLQNILVKIHNTKHAEITRKNGVQKGQFIIKDLCIHIKALTELNTLNNDNIKSVQDLFMKFLEIFDWIEADSILTNCFLHLVQHIGVSKIGKSCVLAEINGNPLIKALLKKVQAISSKPPHTETNLVLLKNGISTIQCCSHMIDVRIMLKNAKILQILEVLHPQLQHSRKTTWDEVTIAWLKLFEHLARFEDNDCNPRHISLLCRLIRLGHPIIKRISLKIIRNFSMNASIGIVLLASDDFKETVDAILTDEENYDEKHLILQTLLSIASKCEQLKSKLKNSSLNRKLKDQLAMMRANAQFSSNPDQIQIFNLTTMLSEMLYPQD